MIFKFARFAYHILRLAYPAVAADKRKLAADYRRRILVTLNHDLGEHRRNRGFAVSAANAVAVGIEPCYRAEQVGAFNSRDSRIFRRNKLGIVGQNGRRVNNKLGALYVFRSLTESYGDSETANPCERVGLIIVRTGKLIALLVQYFGKRTHT